MKLWKRYIALIDNYDKIGIVGSRIQSIKLKDNRSLIMTTRNKDFKMDLDLITGIESVAYNKVIGK